MLAQPLTRGAMLLERIFQRQRQLNSTAITPTPSTPQVPLNGWHFIVAAILLNKLSHVKLDGIGAVITDREEAVIVDGCEGGWFHHPFLPSQPHSTRSEQISKPCAHHVPSTIHYEKRKWGKASNYKGLERM
jgi:hypothetical protein